MLNRDFDRNAVLTLALVCIFIQIAIVNFIFSETPTAHAVFEFNKGGGSPQNLITMSEGNTRNIIAGGVAVGKVDQNGIEYFHSDRLGNNRVVTDIEANKISEFKALPFGQTVKKSTNRYEFTGKEKDESNLYHFEARQYDPNLGKFTSTDPVLENDPFTYTKSNPLKYIDPDGREVWLPQDPQYRKQVMSALNKLGAGSFSSEKYHAQYRLIATDNYKGNYPKTFQLVKDVVDHDKILHLDVSWDSLGHFETGELYTDTPNNDYPDWLNSVIQFSGKITAAIAEKTNNKVIIYNPNPRKDIFTEVSPEFLETIIQNPEIALFHEFGHARAYLRGEPFLDIHGPIDQDNPEASGPAVKAEFDYIDEYNKVNDPDISYRDHYGHDH